MIFVNVLSKMQQTQSVALVKLLPKIRAFLSFFFRARVTEFAYSRLIRAWREFAPIWDHCPQYNLMIWMDISIYRPALNQVMPHGRPQLL